jgi:hypothetical protein
MEVSRRNPNGSHDWWCNKKSQYPHNKKKKKKLKNVSKNSVKVMIQIYC